MLATRVRPAAGGLPIRASANWIAAGIVALSPATPDLGRAAWLPDGNPVGDVAGDQSLHALRADGSGGCYVVWSTAGSAARVLRFGPDGDVVEGWPAAGVEIPGALPNQGLAVEADANGLFFAWGSGTSVWVHRIGPNGAPAPGWPSNGIEFRESLQSSYYPVRVLGATRDGAGGAFIAWDDGPCTRWDEHGTGDCIWWDIQHTLGRVTGAGTRAAGWPQEGLGVWREPTYFVGTAVWPRGADGAFLVDPDGYGATIRVHALGAAGQSAGLRTIGLTSYLSGPASNSDLQGGLFLAWKGFLDASLQVLRFASDGSTSPGWPEAGRTIPMPNPDIEQYLLEPLADGSVIVSWTPADVPIPDRALRLLPDGAPDPAWPADGSIVGPEGSWKIRISCPSGAPGVFFGLRYLGTEAHVAHLRVDGLLDPGWGEEGIARLTQGPVDDYTLRLVPDGAGGVFGAWEDLRNGGPFDTDVYLQHLDSSGDVFQANRAPDVSAARVSQERLWPARGDLVPVSIEGVTDPEGDAITIAYTSIAQDEPLDGAGDGHTCPDATILNGVAAVRRERAGGGDGRVYEIGFTATDAHGAATSGTVTACVPHDADAAECVDSGRRFDSRGACDLRTREVETELAPPSLRVLTLRGRCEIEYELPAPATVNLELYDPAGRRVATIDRGAREAGLYRAVWGTESTAAGLYFVRLTNGTAVIRDKIAITR